MKKKEIKEIGDMVLLELMPKKVFRGFVIGKEESGAEDLIL